MTETSLSAPLPITRSYCYTAVFRRCSRPVRGKQAILNQWLSQMVENKRARPDCRPDELHHYAMETRNG